MCMYKKCVCLISLVLVLGLAGNVLAVDRDWTNANGNRLWTTAANWSGNAVPTSADKAAVRNNFATTGPIINSTMAAVAAQVVVGDWSSTGGDSLDMTGGTLTTSSWFVLGYGPLANRGTFNISGGTVNCPSTLYVGNTGVAIGTLAMTGGTITATTFGIAQVAGSTGDVFLDGGTISCGTFSITTSGGAMDITLGTLIVNGDVTSTINGYISSGQLTGFGGSGTLNVDYNVRNPGKTTVTAQSPEKASYPSPANGATGISINADLSWIAGMYATSHDVYFGTDSTPDSTEFKGNQTATTYEPGTLALNTTYYWRIDEVNTAEPNSPWIGDVWSFTTQTGTAVMRKGPYLIYPGNNAQMTVLWQLDTSETCTIEWGTDTTYSTGSANVSEYGTDHQYKYNITGLTPGTKYYYRITTSSGYSTGNFNAAPAASATDVKFFMYGDTRTNGSWNNSVCARMISTYTADPCYQTMVLHAGDWVNADAEADWTSQWYNYSWTSLMTAPANMAFQGCIGNHEGGASVYKKYRPFPFVAATYFSYDYGPVHVTVVDQYQTYTNPSTQYTWLVNDLSGTTKPWKIIVLHEPGWSAYGSGAHANNTTVQGTIQPLCITYGVQIVLAGHNHFYSRCAVSGVQHVTNGAGGAPFYGIDLTRPYVVTATANTLAVCKVDIQGDSLTCTTVSDGGTVIDTFTLSGGGPPLPGKATNPSPANGATNVATNATLSWTAGSDATSHDVYFGTTSPGTFKGNQTGTTYNPGTLAGNTTYYWRIDEKNVTGTTTGDVWNFTTAAAPLFSDGFESGNFTAGGWTTQNTNATVATAAKYTGVYGAKLAGTTWMQKAVSTVGYNTIHVKYARKTAGLDAGEYLYVEWSIDGSAWNNLETVPTAAWAVKDFTCGSGANNNANFRVRWRTNANKPANEYAYVDDVMITGTAQ